MFATGKSFQARVMFVKRLEPTQVEYLNKAPFRVDSRPYQQTLDKAGKAC
jgi:hypothetical protein